MDNQTPYLKTLNLPDGLHDLTNAELERLATEVRTRILDVCSTNGGHLAPSLGTVELTLALLSELDMNKDQLIWDVGHQSYPFKILTGRAEAFSTLRKKDGLAGFPRRAESPYDVFGVGHSSTSISAALGFAAARDLSGLDHHVVAVIGDGALTGGEAFEGLNLAGHQGRRLIVILNDNEMSIAPNVGALSRFLSRTLTRRWFRQTRKDVLSFLRTIPRVGGKLAVYAERGEWSFKSFFTPGMLFEAFRFAYIGPVDGHDIPTLRQHLERALAVESGRGSHPLPRCGALCAGDRKAHSLQIRGPLLHKDFRPGAGAPWQEGRARCGHHGCHAGRHWHNGLPAGHPGQVL